MRTDVNGVPLVVGGEYEVGRVGQKLRVHVRVEESDYCDDLIAVDQDSGLRYRIDDLNEGAAFFPRKSSVDLRAKLLELRKRASSCSQSLRAIEQEACSLLGIRFADGSEPANFVMNYIVDGIGSPELLIESVESAAAAS